MLDNGLYQLLTETSSISSLLANSTSVYFSVLPKQSPLPAIVIHTVVTTPIVTLDATADLVPRRMQFDCYAGDQQLTARALAEAVAVLLEDFSGALPDGTIVDGCVLNNNFDNPFEEGGTGYTYRAIVDITISYKNA